MTANREHYPRMYDLMFEKGRQAAKAGDPRRAPEVFQYEYAAECWFDGYDSFAAEEAAPMTKRVNPETARELADRIENLVDAEGVFDPTNPDLVIMGNAVDALRRIADEDEAAQS